MTQITSPSYHPRSSQCSRRASQTPETPLLALTCWREARPRKCSSFRLDNAPVRQTPSRWVPPSRVWNWTTGERSPRAPALFPVQCSEPKASVRMARNLLQTVPLQRQCLHQWISPTGYLTSVRSGVPWHMWGSSHPAPLVHGSPTPAREQLPSLPNTRHVFPNGVPRSLASHVAHVRFVLPSFPVATTSSATPVPARSAHQMEIALSVIHRSPQCYASTSSPTCQPYHPHLITPPCQIRTFQKISGINKPNILTKISYFHFFVSSSSHLLPGSTPHSCNIWSDHSVPLQFPFWHFYSILVHVYAYFTSLTMLAKADFIHCLSSLHLELKWSIHNRYHIVSSMYIYIRELGMSFVSLFRFI